MSRLPAFILAIAAAVACAAPTHALSLDELAGDWKVDPESLWSEMLKQPEFAAMPAEQRDGMKGMLLPMFEKMRVAFTADGMTVTDPTGKQEKGTDFTSTGAKTATVKDPKGAVSDLTLGADGAITMLSPDERDPTRKMTMVLRRAGADAKPAAPAAPAPKK